MGVSALLVASVGRHAGVAAEIFAPGVGLGRLPKYRSGAVGAGEFDSLNAGGLRRCDFAAIATETPLPQSDASLIDSKRVSAVFTGAEHGAASFDGRIIGLHRAYPSVSAPGLVVQMRGLRDAQIIQYGGRV
jgi:hypothetical protein